MTRPSWYGDDLQRYVSCERCDQPIPCPQQGQPRRWCLDCVPDRAAFIRLYRRDRARRLGLNARGAPYAAGRPDLRSMP